MTHQLSGAQSGWSPRAIASLTAPVAPVGIDAWRIRDGVASGELRIRDVIEAHLSRLDDVQPALNAAVVICRDQALAQADSLQTRLDSGETPGPLAGVPFTVKDVIATAGIATRCGSRAFIDNVPVVDAVAVGRLRAAGAVLIAKTNCPEFAFGVTTENAVFGRTVSPFGPHSAGGSSGGEAALVASGASAFGVGADYGGSLRWPAQCCGVLSLRPGIGTVDGSGQLPERGGRMDGYPGDDLASQSVQRHFQVIGPLARSSRDLALVLAIMARPSHAHGSDSVTPDFGGVDHATAIGWIESEDSQRIGSDVQSVILGFVDRLQRLGHVVSRQRGLFDGLHSTFNALRATDPLVDLRTAVGSRWTLVGADARRNVQSAPSSNADPRPLWDDLARRRKRVLDQLARTPVLLLAVAPVSSCSFGGSADVDGDLVSGFGLMAQCRAVSALGLPSLSVPIGVDHGGLPVSIQIIGGPGAEHTVLACAALFETYAAGVIDPPWLSP